MTSPAGVFLFGLSTLGLGLLLAFGPSREEPLLGGLGLALAIFSGLLAFLIGALWLADRLRGL